MGRACRGRRRAVYWILTSHTEQWYNLRTEPEGAGPGPGPAAELPSMKDEAYRLMADLDESYWWYRARREIVCDVVSRFVPPGRDVVDYGCGTGAIAARLRDLGYRAIGA